jgi:spermidine synthase
MMVHYYSIISELFRDHGIIEKYPQRWTFQPSLKIAVDDDGNQFSQAVEPPLKFTLEEDEEGKIEVEWDETIDYADNGKNYVRRVFRKHLQRLYRFKNVVYDMSNPDGIPKNEWDATWKYYDVIKSAFVYAIHSLENDGEDGTAACAEGQSHLEGACAADILELYEVHYHDLGWEEDDLDYIEPTCNTSQIIQYVDYPLIDERQTNYQLLTFWERESDDDICMNLENTLQICSTYRPHYHEFFVHYPARYMASIKRVIFIGGGDAMLLHEVLKFPSLENVVGLELDQQVTRKSFNYFKSQPHWDDRRVEWWYGDATKSLTLLPQDYWGSFDLVLVDLSETVMSMSVTGELDIFAALALLLKPEGIMVKNEPYIDQFSDFFDHTIHIYYGTPKICTQVLVMGSNKVDFLHHPVTEHPEIERLLLEPLDDPSDRFKYMHDYRKNNATEQGKCNTEEGTVTTQHGKKAGIMEIVEAENVTIALDKTFEAKIYSIVEENGLTPVSTPAMKDGPIVVVMKEGYVVARMWPEHKYCALDIHLWGAFQKSSALRSALTEALGSKTVSAFRIVAGGMFGANTLVEDRTKAIGIQVSQTRNCQPEELKSGENADDEKALKAALVHSIDLVEKEPNLKAVVLCGYKGKDECESVDVLSKDDRVKHVVPIWACDSLQATAGDPTNYSKMYECEKRVEELLTANSGEDDEVDMLIVDGSAPREMAQILSSTFSYAHNRAAFLSDEHLFITMMKEQGSEVWRREFLEQYRKEKHEVPLFRTEVVMETGDRRLGLELLYCGENSFLNLHAMESSLSDELVDYTVEIKRITGGLHFYDPEYNMKEFPDLAYGRQPATEQGENQLALGRQSIFQFEYFGDDESEMPSLDKLITVFGATLEKTKYTPSSEDKYMEVGDGAVFVSKFSEGSAVLVWDGSKHVDVNLFSSDQSEERANEFGNKFTELSGLSSYLRDDQPRGTGRVMQFEYEELFR